MKDYQINSNYNYSWETIKSMLQKLDGIIPDLQPKLTAGDNIAISEQNVISATDTKYTAGDNVSISDQNVISATDTKYYNHKISMSYSSTGNLTQITVSINLSNNTQITTMAQLVAIKNLIMDIPVSCNSAFDVGIIMDIELTMVTVNLSGTPNFLNPELITITDTVTAL